ncbi:hypothetical protein MYXO_03581 [Myxococcaceae bacterium]|nr:hypothetical protein MYXO_03581 [Myxococcaceae bacterium]
MRSGLWARILVSMLLAADAASAAETLGLRPRLETGDAYALSLSVLTETEAFSKGVAGERYEETVRIVYAAAVTVLEVDDSGRPLRERHDRASLTFERPGESGSLFKESVTLEVERKEGLEVRLGGRRVEARIERLVSDVLEKQFEHTLEPAFLDPGRSVEVGESWLPDEHLAKRFLASRGIRVVDFAEGASARLVRDAENEGALVIDYEIPISRFELAKMPSNAMASNSEATLEGRVRLAAEPREGPVLTKTHLAFRLNGISRTTAQSLPWHLRSSVTVERSSQRSQDVALSELRPSP